MIKSIKILPTSLQVRFKNEIDDNFPNIWLRDHAKDEENWDYRSNQRKTYTASLSSKLFIKEASIIDNGKYIKSGLVIARNPQTGDQNVSINRLQVSGKDRLGILILPRDLHKFFDMAENLCEIDLAMNMIKEEIIKELSECVSKQNNLSCFSQASSKNLSFSDKTLD